MGVIRRSSFDLLKDSKQLVRVRSDGQVSFNPGGVIRSFCQLDLFLFPYDVQRCHIEFEAWRYNMAKQRFGRIRAVMSKLFFKSEEWDVIDFNSNTNIFNYSSGSFHQVSCKNFSFGSFYVPCFFLLRLFLRLLSKEEPNTFSLL